MHVKYKKIEDIGLRSYLDETANLHDGLGYDRFVEYFDRRKINQLNLAKLFLVNRATMKKWILIHEKERHSA